MHADGVIEHVGKWKDKIGSLTLTLYDDEGHMYRNSCRRKA